jgi:hypothetical protein
MEVHADLRAAKRDSFRFKAQSLIGAGTAGEQDLSSGPQHAMPWQPAVSSAQRPSHLTRRSGESRSLGHRAVGRDFASRDFSDDGAELSEHSQTIFTQRRKARQEHR